LEDLDDRLGRECNPLPILFVHLVVKPCSEFFKSCWFPVNTTLSSTAVPFFKFPIVRNAELEA
jgi:hypothetical protein